MHFAKGKKHYSSEVKIIKKQISKHVVNHIAIYAMQI